MSELTQYDYELPKHLIAQQPAANRVDARLMVVDRVQQSIQHRHVRDLPELLKADDCLVLNNTRVVPARLLGYRTATGGHWEGLFLEVNTHGLWRVLGKTRGKLVAGETITLVNAQGKEDIRLRCDAKQPDGSWVVHAESEEETFALLERVGRVPLPPYIRKGEMIPADREHYQTIFAERPGSVAAPTAGLHFTTSLIDRLKQQGTTVCRLTLHVGLGTFRPISVERLDEHPMHSEWGELPADVVETIAACRERGGRVVAVGSTSLRVLETAASSGTLQPFRGYTDLYVRPGYQFHIVDTLMTNFHLPRTTLLVLIRTFGGDALLRRAYEEAIREEYRFFSYGDAMLIV